jgi:hypothetical protein
MCLFYTDVAGVNVEDLQITYKLHLCMKLSSKLMSQCIIFLPYLNSINSKSRILI